MWCVMIICSFCSLTQATLEPTLGRDGYAVFGVAWHRETFHRLGVQDVTKFDSD
jgi:hypothetical protein